VRTDASASTKKMDVLAAMAQSPKGLSRRSAYGIFITIPGRFSTAPF